MSFQSMARRPIPTGPLLLIFAAFVAAGSANLLWTELEVRRTWHEVEGHVLGAQVFSTGGRPKRSSNTRVTFRYTIDGATHVGTTAFREPMEFYYATQKTLEFGTGTRHRIWYRPGDPKEIRLDLDDAGALIGPVMGTTFGLVILAGYIFWWRKPGAKTTPDRSTNPKHSEGFGE